MADEIRCPHCGHLNPPEAEMCQSCQELLPAQPGAMPDWLRDMQGAAGGRAAEDSAADGDAAMPDWLGGLSGDEQAAEPDATESGGEPDWLADLLGGQEMGLGAEEKPDWLTQDASVAPPFAAETPDWLGAPPAEPPAEPAAEPASTPDWLTDLPPAQAPTLGATPAFLPDEPSAAAPTPDWLAGLDKPSAQPPPGDMPAFIMDDEPGQAAAPASDFLTTLPDWVSQVSAEDLPPEEAQEGEGGLTQSALPTWLEAMRPVESAAPSATPFEDVSGAEMVTSGPLAGLRGVLVAEPDVNLPHKPPAYSVKLRVTDEQKARVAMLQELLASEDKPRPLAAAPTVNSLAIFRLLIALALILPILWMRITGATSLAAPAAQSLPGVSQMRNVVASLPHGAPVLVAVDYEPGFSGEVEAAASAVLAHIMQRGAYLVLVSTSPTGPVLAEGLMADLTSQPAGIIDPSTAYINLGYLPGGAAGLLGLAQAPSQAMPYTLQDVAAWEQPPLDAVRSAADFALVVVLTDDPNTGRTWIEQVGPALGETPLVMVTSAQAEPLLQPYLLGAHPQVNGLVSGLAGGVAYGAFAGSDSSARSLWDGFGVGMVAAIVVIVAGSLLWRVLASAPTKTARKEK